MPLHAINEIPFSRSTSHSLRPHPYLNLRASRSDSSRQRMSSSRTVRYLLAKMASLTIPSHNCVSWIFRASLRDGGLRTWALDVADNASGGIVHELDSDLSDTSTGAYLTKQSASTSSHSSPFPLPVQHTSSAQNTSDLDQLDGNL